MPAPITPPQDKPSARTPWQPSKAEQYHLDTITRSLKRTRQVTAEDPYVLAIPQDVEPRYHHTYAAAATQWLHGTPFSSREHEATQYQTFVFYEPGKEIYVQHNPRVTGASADGTYSSPRVAPLTSNAPKKKISLSAYKKKHNGGIANGANAKDAPVKQTAVKGPAEQIGAETQEMLAALAEMEEPVEQGKPVAEKDLKRKREDEKSGETKPSNIQTSEAQAQADAPAAKKPRTATPPPATTKPVAASANTTSETNLPPRLSPGMPPRLSPGLPAKKIAPLANGAAPKSPKAAARPQSERLPPRLSPDIPENIVQTLEKRFNLYPTPRSSDPSEPSSAAKESRSTPIKKPESKPAPIEKSESNPAPIKKPDGITKAKAAVPRNAYRASSSSPAVSSDADARSRQPAAATNRRHLQRRESSAESHIDEIAVSKKIEKPKSKITPTKSPEPRLLVKFKIKKGQKESIGRILQMRARPARALSEEEEYEEAPLPRMGKTSSKTGIRRVGEPGETTNIKGVAQRVCPSKKAKKQHDDEPPPSKKRAYLSDDEEKSGKRVRVDSTASSRKDPSTPAQPAGSSTPATSSSAQKAQPPALPSARKELLAVPMQREKSKDSVTSQTPPEPSHTPSIASTSKQQPNGHAPTTTNGRPWPTSHPKTPAQAAWEKTHDQLSALGRKLKHSSTAHATAHPPSSKLAAATALESLLAYFFAFSAADSASAAAEVKRAPSVGTWRSLHGWYAAVRRAVEGYPDLGGLVAGLGVCYHVKIMEAVRVAPGAGEGAGFGVQEYRETQAGFLRCAGEAERLGFDALLAAFPEAWEGREVGGGSGSGREVGGEPGVSVEGAYSLPLGPGTSALRAARAGRAMLREWIRRERVEYELQLGA